MDLERIQKLNAQLRPWAWAEAAAGTALLAALALGHRDAHSPILLALIGLTAAVNAARNVKKYSLLDEYERSLMLRAVAAAFIFLMVSVFVSSMVGLLSPAFAVSPLLLMVLFLASHIVMSVVHGMLQRREATAE